MRQEMFYIKYKDSNGKIIESIHEDVELYRQQKKIIADHGGIILQTKGPQIQEGMQVLSE